MEQKNDRQLFGFMNIFFNAYGVPQFMRGKTKDGILHIVFSIISCGIMGIVYTVKGIIEGVRILKQTDEEYMAEKYAETVEA